MLKGGALLRAPVFCRWLLSTCLLVVQLEAIAADPTTPEAIEARGRELYDNGAILYDEGRYDDAIIAWQEGYRLTARPGFLFNIANAQERLGDYAAAIDTLGRYRALAKTEERETLDRRIRNLEERMAALPAPKPVPVPVPDKPPKEGGGIAGRSVAGVSLIGVGAAGLVTGGVFGLRSKASGKEAEALCGTAGGGLLCPGEAEPLLATNRRSALAADIGFSVGAAASIGGALLLVLGSGPGSQDRDDRLSLRPYGSGLVLTVPLP